MITFNGISSDSLGVVVERYPDQPGAQKIVHSVQIPGRSGELTIDTGAYSNYTQTYDVYFKAGNNSNSPATARTVRQWLQYPSGYKRLTDTYDPDVFRLARYISTVDVENVLNKYGRCSISFDCAPQRFLLSGESMINMTTAGTLENSWMPSKPLIYVTMGTSEGVLTIGNYSVQIKMTNNYLYLDCETQEAYRGINNLNSSIYTDEFPVLENGENDISWSGGVSFIRITPRWWML